MKKLFMLLFVVCFTMCKQKPQTNDAIFVDLDRPEKASLFDYFRSIELIPLETSSDVLIVKRFLKNYCSPKWSKIRY